MIARKPVELLFRWLPLLLLPVLIAPALVIYVFQQNEPEYRSSATVWISEATGLGSLSLGAENRFSGPARRQSQVLSDLLSTSRFREEIAIGAGLVPEQPEGSANAEFLLRRGGNIVARSVGAREIGFNILGIFATHTDPIIARDIVRSTIDTYLGRISDEGTRQTEIAVAYFSEQLAVARETLQEQEAALDAYLIANPSAPESGAGDTEYRSLLAAVQTQDELMRRLDLQLQDWHLNAASASQGQEARFNVQDEPTLPAAALPEARTQRFVLPFASAIFGAMVSAAFLYVVIRADHAIRSIEDIEGLGVPLLGYIPQVTPGQNQPWYKRLYRRERHFARRLAASLAMRSPTGGST